MSSTSAGAGGTSPSKTRSSGPTSLSLTLWATAGPKPFTRAVAAGGGHVTAWREGEAQCGPALAVALSDSAGATNLSAASPALATLASEHLQELDLWRVAVDGPAVHAFCSALEDVHFLPALSVLVIAGPSSVFGVDALAYVLPNSLAHRARAGHALKELNVVACGAKEECARRLQEAVPGMDVNWRRAWR
ncbi:hypothetical protein FA95DRAFT_1680371 [Auriscalpium vulgare]|uniref:Uncharacterized protein n=1 Tax=Auriscalpium vulgare TaxID=40419 RepID=A0ACB8RPT2_9AGAM|nr:hypothetical protein FA95DRAFT_1680371 [Auriscalpium vulgare]